MVDKNLYYALWSWCEYFLAHAGSGVNLISFDLIRETYQGKATSDAYICERLTRPALAKSARGIKRFVQDYVARDRLGQLEGTAKSLGESLKANLQEETVRQLSRVIEKAFLQEVYREEAPETLLILSVIYYTYYKNKQSETMGFPPWLTQIFLPLLIKSQEGDLRRLEDWLGALKKLFSVLWRADDSPGEKLQAFFDHEVTVKVTSYSLAAVFGFIKCQEDKALRLFEVTHQLSDQDMRYFRILAANGLSAALNKKKRYPIRETSSGTCQALRIGIISKEQIREIVDKAVDANFDPALDLCVQYHLSLAEEHPRGKLAKLFDKTFLTMNRDMWRELLTLADVQRRVVFRTRHMLRVVIHYLFEIRGIEREFWRKYISSVDSIITFAFEEDKERLRQFNTRLGRELSRFRNSGEYQATDWEGFYRAPDSRDIALAVIQEVAQKARSNRDSNLPAVWFTNLAADGVDDEALYRFFRQGGDSA